MIKKYNQYIKETKFNEELNFRNLFRKNKEYKPISNEVPVDASNPERMRNILDPYGEEDWEMNELTPVLQKAREQGKPFDEIIILNCSNIGLENLDGIEQLVNLEKLFCYNNQLTSLKGIENLQNLKKLYCSSNQLTGLKGIENLHELEILYCNNNQLTSLKGIENLHNLKELWCSSNQLNSLEKLRNLSNLKELNCRHNQLTSLEGIENLKKFKTLYCSDNNFSNDYKEYIKKWAIEKNINLNI